MKFKTRLGTKDYVTYHLFQASMSDQLKKRRLRHWFGVPLVYFITGYGLKLLKGPEIVQYVFYATGVIWLILYRFYSRWAIPRFMSRQVAEKYRDILDKEGILNVSDRDISLKNDENTLSIKFDEVKSIYEIPSHFLVELENGFSLILPKKQGEDQDLLDCISRIATKSGKPITDRLDWKWG